MADPDKTHDVINAMIAGRGAMEEFDRKREVLVREHRVRVLGELRKQKDASRLRATNLAEKLCAIQLETDEEKIEQMSLIDLKSQFSAHKHRARLDPERQPFFKLLKLVVKGTDPSRKQRPSLHESERQRIIAVVKHTLKWRNALVGVVPPETTFEGFVRVGDNHTQLGYQQ